MALRLNTPERLKLSWSQKKNILRKALLIKIFWATWLKFQPPKVKKIQERNRAVSPTFFYIDIFFFYIDIFHFSTEFSVPYFVCFCCALSWWRICQSDSKAWINCSLQFGPCTSPWQLNPLDVGVDLFYHFICVTIQLWNWLTFNHFMNKNLNKAFRLLYIA